MYTTGFSPEALAIQLIEIAIFVPLILIGLSRAGAWALSRMGSDEEAHFLLMLAVMAVAGAIADLINRPGIVGAFLAGLAVNSAVQDDPARVKLEFFGKSKHGQSLVHPELLCRHRSGDRSGRVCQRRRRPFPPGLGDRREIEELSYHQISAVTALPIGTVLSRLARARKAFGDTWRREMDAVR
jgi:hypothetical protein